MADDANVVDSLAQSLRNLLDSPAAAWGKHAPELIHEWMEKKVNEEKVDRGLCEQAAERVIGERFRRR